MSRLLALPIVESMNYLESSGRRSCHPRHPRLGLPAIAILGLALLAVPRVVLHDLAILDSGSLANALFVFVPPVLWIVVAVWRRVPNAFLTILVIGALYGAFLAIGHQLFWEISFSDSVPRLGGKLTDVDPAIQAGIFRAFAAISSLFTGAIVGAITGLIAWGIQALFRRP